jgi:two-component system OmpR family response regulator
VDTNLTIAQDGEQALTHLRGSQFNLVILDLNLPRRDGQTILRLCATADGSPPFVVFSGSESPSDRELALLAGAKEYVVKPSGLDDFIESVQGIVKRWSFRPDPIS